MSNILMSLVSDADSVKLGYAYIIGFIGLVGGGVTLLITKFSPAYMERKRDREIETAMRMGVRDAEAQQRIGQQIINERQQQQR